MRVVVADDSILFRRLIKDALTALPETEVVGQAPNGRIALQKVLDLKPDLLTLDLEMPEMDGLSVLDAMKKQGCETSVIMVSSHTLQGGYKTMKALQKGAFDFITKPTSGDLEKSKAELASELTARLKALSLRLSVRRILQLPKVSGSRSPGPGNTVSKTPATPAENKTGPSNSEIDHLVTRPTGRPKPELILIGVSTGGPQALAHLLPQLPQNLGSPILIVQHMPALFTRSMAESLNGKCGLRVVEAEHQQLVEKNTVYIAPGGRQMRLAPGQEDTKTIQITDDPPENNCRPAVDYLFRSAALHFPGRSMAIVLTGMGSDGALGVKLLKRHGCFVIAQDEASCVVYGMPKAVVDNELADVVLPLDRIPDAILNVIRKG